jgi:hypothetical protein
MEVDPMESMSASPPASRHERKAASKNKTNRKPARKPHKPPPPPLVGPPMAYSVAAFCTAHAISQAMFYKLRGQGLGPDVTRIGTRTLITAESAARWRAAREAATATAQQRAERTAAEADTAQENTA